MELFFRDEGFVFNRRFVGNNDVVVAIYTKKLGVENVFIQNGQLVKNLPYIYLDKFTHIRCIFTKLKDGKVYIYDIDSVKTLGIEVSRNVELFQTLTDISSIIYTYTPYGDTRIFNLYKKTVFYCLNSGETYKYYLVFLTKLNYLAGVYNPVLIDNHQLAVKLLTTKIADVENIEIDRQKATYLSAVMLHNIKRWLE